MIINDRTITLTEYRTDQNWLAKLPQHHWVCVLLVHEKRGHYIDEILPKLLLRNVAYVCSIGRAGEWAHDCLDEEVVFRDVEQLYLPPHRVVTTWHPDLEEGMWHAVWEANHDHVPLHAVAVLDLTGGAENAPLQACLSKLQDKA
ncbi:DUF7684 family protein [Hymenobacter sp. HD11105]